MQKSNTIKIQPKGYKLLFRVALMLCFIGIFQHAQSQDVGVVSLLAPDSSICAATNQTVVVRIKNFGSDSVYYNVDTVIVTVNITGASTQTYNDTLIVGNLAPDSIQDITVTFLCDLSASGTHIFNAYTTLTGDLSALNDTLVPLNITVIPLPSIPTITVYGSTTFCEGDSVLLVSSIATGNLWTGGTTNDSLMVLISGSFTDTVSGGGCSATSVVTTIAVNPFPPIPTITAYDTTVFCVGDSVLLVSSSTTGNVWTGGSTNDSLTVFISGEYTVTVTSAGCSSSSDTTIVVANSFPAVPTITASDTTVLCLGGSVILYSSSSTGNTWTGGSTSDSLIVSAGGSYSVTVTIDGCSAVSADTTVTVNSLPTVTLASFSSSPCAQASEFSLTGGLPAGGIYSGIGVDSVGVFHPGSAGAVQGIIYTITDINGCSNSTSQNMTVHDCTGIEEIMSQGIIVYPNPCTNGSFSIAIKNANFTELLISILDIQGKEVFRTLDKNTAANYTKQINISNLAKGLYYIRLSADAEVKIQKLIVE